MLVTALLLLAAPAAAHPTARCDAVAWRSTARGPGDAHIRVARRADALATGIGAAERTHRIGVREARDLRTRVSGVRTQNERLTHAQGFLSAAERATFDRVLDGVARRVCGGDQRASR